jgi:hypothetical protein
MASKGAQLDVGMGVDKPWKHDASNAYDLESKRDKRGCRAHVDDAA